MTHPSDSAPIPPRPTAGLRHIALYVAAFEAAEHFYTELMGMQVEWRPDPDNVYLTSGNDNLALHRYEGGERPQGRQRLDHIGFIINDIDQVDVWYAWLLGQGVHCLTQPRTHRDGARSFYCHDPDGNAVQLIYHPPLSDAFPKG